MGNETLPFWKTKKLSEMSLQEWDSLCDGCAKCCLHKLEDQDTGDLSYTDVACHLLDTDACLCNNYTERTLMVPDCIELMPTNLSVLRWLPPTCAYRLINEGKELYWWHYLVSGSREDVHKEGISVRGRAVPERRAGDLEDHIVHWPEDDYE
jgi:uncharacterized cysteine cluster protein YcgN (CxxCxxCC family)